MYRLKSGSAQFHLAIDDTSAANDSAGTRMKIYVAPRMQFWNGIPDFSQFVFVDSVDFKPGTTDTGVLPDIDIPTTGVNGQGKYEDALKHLEDALTIHKKIDNPRGQASDLMNIGLVYFNQNKPQEALKLLEEAVSDFENAIPPMPE